MDDDYNYNSEFNLNEEEATAIEDYDEDELEEEVEEEVDWQEEEASWEEEEEEGEEEGEEEEEEEQQDEEEISDLFFPPHIIVKDSIFQNNILALSNSLAISGTYNTLLDGNLFQDNGAPSGDELIKYSLNLSQVGWDNQLDSKKYSGQSTAVYINGFFKLKTSKNTFKGNWSPFEGARSLGVSLTLLNWTNYFYDYDLTLEMEDDMFVDHIGVPPIIDSSVAKQLNCYAPPLITLADTLTRYYDNGDFIDPLSYLEVLPPPKIRLKGVKFENNIANFTSVCDYLSTKYNFTTLLIRQMQENSRFRSGFFRFLTPSDAADKAIDIENTLDPVKGAYSELGLYFSEGEIRNNTVDGGCMFPTLRLRVILLEDLQIESNKINQNLESNIYIAGQRQPNSDNVLNNRMGIFCGYQKNAVEKAKNLIINANKMKVRNNIGPIFSLFPDELNYLFLMNSLFINNICEYTSTVIGSPGSHVYSSNNIFFNNTNAFGTVFTTSPSNVYLSSLTTYLNNDGRHASLIYSDNNATVIQTSSSVYSNTVSPTSYVFEDNATPQGGLYFLSSSAFILTHSTFSQNNAYAGCIVSSASTVVLRRIQFSDHSVYGSGVVGNFLAGSDLTITDANITNSSIAANPVSQFQAAFITVVSAKIKALNIQIVETPASNVGAIFLGKIATGDFTNLKLTNLTTSDENGLISLTFSNISVTNIFAKSITLLFSLYRTQLDLTSVFIEKLKSSSDSFYLFNTVSSNLTISKFDYSGEAVSGDYLSLISGLSNRIIISEAHFADVIYGNNNNLFDLKESSLFFITNSLFEYTSLVEQPILFVFESSQVVIIEKCTFINLGQLVQDQNTKSLHFISNTIVTKSSLQKISTIDGYLINVMDNDFISPIGIIEQSIPTTQIQIVDSTGLIKLKDNIFFSLSGSKGIVLVGCTKTPYNLESTGNSFISNSGSYGGALHLDASLSSASSILPSATINSTVFLLNKAVKIESASGKGGAIYQTTSTLTKQTTAINSTWFIKNTAEIVGGAIFFDYMLPIVNKTSEFRNNSANNRANHIGSYPIRLDYYYNAINLINLYDKSPALPWDTPPRILSSSGLTEWNNIPSGLTSNQAYRFALFDRFGQIFDSDNISTLEVDPAGLTEEQRYDFSNKLSVTPVNGIYVYDSFRFTYKTYGAINVTFKSTAIQESKQPALQEPLIVYDSLLVEAHFRGCGRGEYVKTESENIICIECQPGFWQTSPNPDALSCQACDSTSTICLGADNVGTHDGYWRLNETANIVLECPISDSCLGSDPNSQGRILGEACAYGYTGNLCSNCISGWGKIDSGACTNCNTNGWYYLKVAGVLLFQLLMIVKSVHGTMTMSTEFNDNQKLSMNGAILIRVLTNYLQLVSIVAGLPVTWPDAIKGLMSTPSQISSVTENIFTFDCLFKSDQVYGIKLVFFKLLIKAVGPFGLIILSIFFTSLYYLIKKKPIRKSRGFKNQIIALTVIICFMMQPSAIQAAFSTFKCENIYRDDSPDYFLIVDYDVQCWQGSHLYWALGFCLPMLIIWAVFLPGLMFQILRKNKNRLEKPEVAQKYSFMYGGYTYDKYYWELVIMFRKFLLISITTGASFYSVNLEIYVSILLILFWCFLHLFTHPYDEIRLNKLEQFSLISAGLVNFSGLYFKFVQSTLWLDVVVVIFGLGGNLLFLIYFAMLYFALQIEKMMQNKKVVEILTKLGLKCKWIHPTKIDRIFKKVSTLIDQITIGVPDLTRQNTLEQMIKKTETNPQDQDRDQDQEHQEKEADEKIVLDQSPGTAKRLLTETFQDDSFRLVTEPAEGRVSPHRKQTRITLADLKNKEESSGDYEGDASGSSSSDEESKKENEESLFKVMTLWDVLRKKAEDESEVFSNK